MRIRAMVWVVLALVTSLSSLGYAQAYESPELEPPRLLNQAELLVAVREHYPLVFRKNGIGGVAQVRLFVDAAGAVDSVRLGSSTGVPELDEAAFNLSNMMKFEPARVGGEPRGLWLELPITMMPPARIDSPSVNVIELANGKEILEAVRENTPEALRKERYVFDAKLWVQVDANGRVVDVDIERTSCVEDTDRIIYHLARALHFRATDGYEGPIDGWTNVKITLDPFPGSAHPVEIEGGREKREAERKVRRKAAQDSAAAAEQGAAPEEPKPVYKRPLFRNQRALEEEISRRYSQELVGAGLTGTVRLAIWIDESGRPHKQQVIGSSGSCQLDLLALEIGQTTSFTPALKDGEPTKTVVTFPITFK